ncbi:hypothetical protein SLE2022_352920 [Rubroshorea leprosula]
MAVTTEGGGGSAAAAAPLSLQDTPTWALATVCFIFISASIFIEHMIHLISNWLKKHRRTALFEAVEKLKSVLMVLGLMSLILTVNQRGISKICVPTEVADNFLPCRRNTIKTTKAIGSFEPIWANSIHSSFHQRILAVAESSTNCPKGMTSLISPQGINQLSIFICVLAVMQIVYCVMTMALGRAKMRRWESWERETQTVDYQVANDPNRFRFTRQTTFGRRHMSSSTGTSIELWIKCFFQHLFNSVAKTDYLTLRHGFISAHLSANSSFNFQRYIQRSLDDDFQAVVGISPLMWLIVVIFMFVDVHGWNVFLWVSFLPLIIVLVLGTKLQVIVARMALKIQQESSVIKGAPLVQPNDDLFWFSHPKFVLTLMHYTLFMNAFEFSFFIWVTWQFGIKSCYHEHTEIIVTRVVLAVTVQVMCSYITLPLYALVTQMGSNFKSTVLENKTANAIKQWHAVVRQRRKKQESSNCHDSSSRGSSSSNRTAGSSNFSSHLHRMPTVAKTSTFPAKHEILEEDNQLTHQGTGPSSCAEIEIPNVTFSTKLSDGITSGKSIV